MMETVQQLPQMCEGCPRPQLIKLGLKAGNWNAIIALAGNPNTGKSTLFNALTGLRQHTGNWPGKTVARMEGLFKYDERIYKIVDLPGTYSLLATSEDEEIARNFVLFGQPDVTVVVVDATRLERNLNLVFQVMEITDRVIVALNLMDEAKRHGTHINHRRLARELGVPVVPMVARSGEGIEDLLETIGAVVSGNIVPNPRRMHIADEKLRQAVDDLTAQVRSAYPALPNARWVALRLLEGDERMVEAVRNGELEVTVQAQTLSMVGAVA
jgi:Fe2+ transport system protein B